MAGVAAAGDRAVPRAVRWLTETPRTLYSGRAQPCPTGRRLDDAKLRSAIDADPDAPATDEPFWKDAQLPMDRCSVAVGFQDFAECGARPRTRRRIGV